MRGRARVLTDEERAENRRRAAKRAQDACRTVVPKSVWSGAGDNDQQDFTPRFQLRVPGWLAEGCRQRLPIWHDEDIDWRCGQGDD